MATEPRLPFGAAATSLAAVVLFPAVLIIAWHGFDGLYGQDSFAYVDYALGPVTQALVRLEPPPAFFWGPGYPLAVAVAALVSGLGAAAAQVTSLAAGATVPVLIAMLARELMPTRETDRARYFVPLLAGLVAALAGQLWQSSIVAMSDTISLAIATLGAWAACRYAGSGRIWALAIAAAAVTFAIETRWVYGLVAVPLALVTLAGIVRVARQGRARALAHVGTGLLVAIVVGLPTLVPIAAAFVGGTQLPFVGDFAVYRWDLTGALRSSFETPDGRLQFDLPTGVFYLLQPVQHYWFAALGLLALPGLAWVLKRPNIERVSLLALWPLVVLGFMIGGAYQNTRFFHAAAPPVAILISLGTLGMWRLIGRTGATNSRAGRWALTAGIAAALLVNAGLAARFTYAFVERVAADAANIRSLAGQVPADARIISLGATPLLRHDGGREVVELTYLDERSVLDLVADRRPTFVMVDIAAIRSQWRDRAPGRAIAALEDARRLRELGAAGIWHLYEVPPI